MAPSNGAKHYGGSARVKIDTAIFDTPERQEGQVGMTSTRPEGRTKRNKIVTNETGSW